MGEAMFDTFTVLALVINFIVVLITLLKMNRQMDGLHGILRAMAKKVAEEDQFIIRNNETINRMERILSATQGDIKWKG